MTLADWNLESVAVASSPRNRSLYCMRCEMPRDLAFLKVCERWPAGGKHRNAPLRIGPAISPKHTATVLFSVMLLQTPVTSASPGLGTASEASIARTHYSGTYAGMHGSPTKGLKS